MVTCKVIITFVYTTSLLSSYFVTINDKQKLIFCVCFIKTYLRCKKVNKMLICDVTSNKMKICFLCIDRLFVMEESV